MSDKLRTIAPAALADSLAGATAPTVIDVLPGNVWEAHHIAGGSSRDTEAAAAKLADLGYTDVVALDGGITA